MVRPAPRPDDIDKMRRKNCYDLDDHGQDHGNLCLQAPRHPILRPIESPQLNAFYRRVDRRFSVGRSAKFRIALASKMEGKRVLIGATSATVSAAVWPHAALPLKSPRIRTYAFSRIGW